MYDEIVEVQEVKFSGVNDYLRNGYQILQVAILSQAAQKPDLSFYTRRFTRYVVGRTIGVAPWSPQEAAVGAEV